IAMEFSCALGMEFILALRLSVSFKKFHSGIPAKEAVSQLQFFSF
ncbi:hypothetical protein OMAG_002815, partial [Candidatus Omnitrophus magneticus]